MKKVIRTLMFINLASFVAYTQVALSYDFPHFYRAAYFFGEPRLGKNGLTSLDVTFAQGSTHKARNCKGDTICLFDLYGSSNMQKLGAGVPGKDPSNPADLALIYLERVPGTNGFGFISYGGKFSLMETIFSLTQNIKDGFFVQCLIPLKEMKVRNICCKDCSPTDNCCCNNKHPYWQMFLNQFNNILTKYNLYLEDWKDTSIGDISLLAGFTCNYQDIKVLDYIDFCIKVGFIIPSGRQRSLNRIFDIPSGYDGHIGIPVQVDASIGLFDWLTAGIHGDVIPFFSKTKETRMKTDYNQCGPIRLAQGCAIINKGPLFDVGAYLKADHFAHGFSLLVGYSYDKQYKDELTLKDTCLFNQQIVNSDSMLHGWDMHTIHFLAEYDFAKDNKRFCPRVSFIYNWQIYGRNVLKNNMIGGIFGFDIAWNY